MDDVEGDEEIKLGNCTSTLLIFNIVNIQQRHCKRWFLRITYKVIGDLNSSRA